MNTVQKTFITFSALITIFFFSNLAYSQDCAGELICSKFKSQSVNQVMAPGKTQSVTVTFQNSSSFTWNSNNIELVYVDSRMNPENNNVWRIDRIAMQTSAVAAGGEVTFQFTITAPTKPGIYNFQWQMSSNGKLFGFSSPSTEIKVM